MKKCLLIGKIVIITSLIIALLTGLIIGLVAASKEKDRLYAEQQKQAAILAKKYNIEIKTIDKCEYLFIKKQIGGKLFVIHKGDCANNKH
tara:strand:+ start:9646 stop:9915 length:270 start_codon:yes stop_codon:yes gene_type:complete